MVSERGVKLRAGLAGAALALAAAAAWHARDAAAWLQLALLIAAMSAAEAWRNLRMLTLPGPPPAAPPADRLHERGVWLEHAPVALLLVGADTPARAEALNAHAHRMLAPGKAGLQGAHLAERLAALALGERTLMWIDSEYGKERMLACASEVQAGGRAQRLVALMPVENELEAETIDAWRELTHVLTHEIMNSLTPIASLTRTAQDLRNSAAAALPADVNEDLTVAFDTIAARAQHLTRFVTSYRTLANLPAPEPETLALKTAFTRLAALVEPDWRARGGRALFEVEPPTLSVHADPGQFEQAMINLLQNAAEATRSVAAPALTVTARQDRGGRVRVDIRDNGPGVPDQVAAQIFTPFFSTKEHGGGIGLSLVRQLLHGNGATVRYVKPVQGGAQFVVTF